MTPEPDSSSKPCPKCHQSVSSDSRYCKYCAFDFAGPEPATSDLSAGLFCPECGEEVGANAVFCGNCGQTIGNFRSSAAISQSKLNTSHILLISGVLAVTVIAVLIILLLNRATPNTQSNTTVQTSSDRKISVNAQPVIRPAQPERGTLTNASVETAINKLTNNLRIGGSLTVVGIQELPQDNAARADIRFNGFQYKSDMAGTPLSKDKSTPKEPDVKSPNFYDEMYKYGTQQVQTRNYSGQGFAVLKRYNDGRWVLKEVHWEFNAWAGNVEIQ